MTDTDPTLRAAQTNRTFSLEYNDGRATPTHLWFHNDRYVLGPIRVDSQTHYGPRNRSLEIGFTAHLDNPPEPVPEPKKRPTALRLGLRRPKAESEAPKTRPVSTKEEFFDMIRTSRQEFAALPQDEQDRLRGWLDEVKAMSTRYDELCKGPRQ